MKASSPGFPYTSRQLFLCLVFLSSPLNVGKPRLPILHIALISLCRINSIHILQKAHLMTMCVLITFSSVSLAQPVVSTRPIFLTLHSPSPLELKKKTRSKRNLYIFAPSQTQWMWNPSLGNGITIHNSFSCQKT